MACAAVGVGADVVPASGAGVAVVLGDASRAAEAVRTLSRLLGRASLLLLVRQAGQVAAERWQSGALQEAPAAGLVLAGLPEPVETLLLTDAPASSANGAVSSVGVTRGGRLGAVWRLVKGARRPS